MAILTLQLNSNLFLRDPQNTALGQKIISQSVEMIHELGFELFTFKKLAEQIDSTEASVYRYFENKHRLLLYLIDLYWTWLEYRLAFEINNVTDAKERLRKCLTLLTQESKSVIQLDFVKEEILRQIVMTEFEKTYLTKQVDADNKEGLFLPYKTICKKIATILQDINPNYPFPHSLASTALLALTHQIYYAQHLPSLSDIKYDPKKNNKKLYEFLEGFLLHSIRK
ncbi:TetR/AcrR family transcriptional regulator [Chryseolinea lacunae]|uniref:TetR/AcrR family transcriptional regulator n=1 Tax=Chryseolinea lacunae TaxID=2801331 RepID=A0ABS1KKQ9_9BACT|nr:TetR/AcrR family transcriptional regulator [Chryseolinea lacunae]MBL0739940.1 TetR/AcrR family transcriptional regulator [Chryseolinea lacunae]